MISGIYHIIHRCSGMTYIGQACDVYRRWGEHRSNLRRGTHWNHHLQRAFSKHGEDAFDFELRETVPADQLTVAEQYHLDSIPNDLRYNVSLVVDSPMLGRTHSPETRAQMSATRTGKSRKPFTPEARANISAARKGRLLTPEHRANISAAMAGKKNSLDHKNALGHKCTDETKAKMSMAHMGQIPWNKGKPWSAERRAKYDRKGAR
jgi:group I intron endonuclease